MSNPPSNTDDVIERIAELEAERAALVADSESASAEGGEGEAAAREDLDDWDINNGEELAALRALAEEGESYASDWQHGETRHHATPPGLGLRLTAPTKRNQPMTTQNKLAAALAEHNTASKES